MELTPGESQPAAKKDTTAAVATSNNPVVVPVGAPVPANAPVVAANLVNNLSISDTKNQSLPKVTSVAPRQRPRAAIGRHVYAAIF